MKKTFYLTLLTFILTMYFTSFTSASSSIPLYIDDAPIATEPYENWGADGNRSGQYYMDVLPELQNQRTYVPISTVSKFLGAQIKWEDPVVTIYYNKTTLVLTIGSTTALQNETIIELDAPPYISKGRTMVPLRFISEAFGCDITYKDHGVHINFPSLKISNTPISGLRKQYYMTMGDMIEENNSNLYINRIYPIIQSSKKTLVSPPNKYGSTIHYIGPDYYYEQMGYMFVDNQDKVVDHYKFYYSVDYEADVKNWIMEDVLNDKWYTFSQDKYYDLVDLENIGEWTVIYNGVP